MDCKKICFIMCVNNDSSFNEAIYYINHLNIPDGYSIDCITIYDSTSMASGYNEAMNASDAKYKIYMHQDVFIIDPDFLYKILAIFDDNSIGLIGLVGAQSMPHNGIMWAKKEIGALYSTYIYGKNKKFFDTSSDKYVEADAVDGFLMATQADLPWREDLFDGWDFYDASQSFEFRKNGYKVVIPANREPMAIHNDGLLNLRSYHKYRKIFLNEYMS